MSVMSRWHKLSCRAPDIHIDGEIPRCRGCESTPDLENLISKQSKSSAPWEAPPDKPIGKLNLHWPSCFRYKRLQDLPETGKAELDEGKLSSCESQSTFQYQQHSNQPPPRTSITKVSGGTSYAFYASTPSQLTAKHLQFMSISRYTLMITVPNTRHFPMLGVERMGINPKLGPFMLDHTGMSCCKPRIVGTHFDIYGLLVEFEWFGSMLFASIKRIWLSEKSR
jgi:hypothetical protein